MAMQANEQSILSALKNALATPRETIAVACDNAGLDSLAKAVKVLSETIDGIRRARGAGPTSVPPPRTGASSRYKSAVPLSMSVATALRAAGNAMSVAELAESLAREGVPVSNAQVSHALANAVKQNPDIVSVGSGCYIARRRASRRHKADGHKNKKPRVLGSTAAIRQILEMAYPEPMHSADIQAALHAKGLPVTRSSLDGLLSIASHRENPFAERVGVSTFRFAHAPGAANPSGLPQ